VPQLYAWLECCGLSFGRWFEQAPYSQCGAIARMPHAARLASLPPPMQHAAVELLRGTITKHSFIAYRDDRPAQSQPITFEGDAWRGYIPLRLPWTLCLRDRAPLGSTAVLINRAHTYADLALPIDKTQGHRQVVGCWIVKGAMDRSTVVGRHDHAAMATPVTSAQVANAWRRAE
jgi:hypothetical protein